MPSPDFCRRDFEASSVYSKLLLVNKNKTIVPMKLSYKEILLVTTYTQSDFIEIYDIKINRVGVNMY